MAEDSSKVLEDALRLESMGIALLPIDPVVKEPYNDLLPKDEQRHARWKPLRETPATPAQIENWFWLSPDFNVAIITGQPSRLAVLDIDGPTPPDLPELPDTVVEKTPREEGGYHYFFRIDGPQKSCLRKWNQDGVDYQCELKADLVYVICSPSNFGAKPYEWLPGCSIFEREPAPLPQELVEYLEGKKRRAKKSKKRKGVAAQSGGATTTKVEVRIEDLEWYEQLKYDEDVAVRIMRQCDADVSALGETFLCPLPGHEEQHPSAALLHNEAGEIIFLDKHARDGLEGYSLANVYALCTTGKQGMSFYNNEDRPWHNRWWARALHESGCVDRPLPVLAMKQDLPKGPDGAPRNAQIVYEAVCYITQLEEWLYGKPKGRGKVGKAIEFPASFTDTWPRVGETECMSRTTRQKGLDWLDEHGYVDKRDVDELDAIVLPSEAAKRSKSSRRKRTYVILTKPKKRKRPA